MADDDRDETPDYTLYRARPRLLKRRDEEASAGLRGLQAKATPDAPARPAPGGADAGRRPGPGGPGRPGGPSRFDRLRRRLTFWRVVGYAALAVGAWLLLSLVLFMVSAQLQRDDVSDAARTALDPGGYTLTSANTVLVLGSDARTRRNREPGSSVIGQSSRADSIMLMRVGGGASARLSIPRDTIVDIPGRGRDKINAAYAIGGPALAIQTVKQYLGIEVNHVVEVNFANFPDLIDSLGGIDYTGGCVISRINGGFANGGYTLRLKSGTNHLDGDQALALARTRTNECNRSESDLTRAKRQQKILAAIRGQVLSASTFVRLPWVSWEAPKAVKSDMAGPALLGLVGALARSGDARTLVLKPSGTETLPDGGAGLVVSDEERRRDVRRFLRG